MTPGHHFSLIADKEPDLTSCILASTGEALSYCELDAATNQTAHVFRDLGLKTRDGIVILCENHSRYYELTWGAHRAGLYFTPVSWHSKAEEIAYILKNSGAKAFIASSRFAVVAAKAMTMLTHEVKTLSLLGEIDGFERLETLRASKPKIPIADEASGREMLYTSGTTGHPKGVKFPLTGLSIDHTAPDDMMLRHEGYKPGAVVMAPGPLYHASPLMTTRAAHRFGASVLIIDKFDAEETLALIEKYKVTHMICVPTHFIRMMKLPEDVRLKYDVSSVTCIMHTGAPCPVDTKRAIIDWFGPVVVEIYSGTERIGGSMIRSDEWLAHPGSIGRGAGGGVYVVDETDWSVLPAGETGVIYFDTGEKFEYHGDTEKTKSLYSPQGWRTYGDIGYVDEDGYIYLTDRKANMIISGGINVYPQESENRLITHPKVADVAVFGIPNAAFGEEVKAVVQPAEGLVPCAELEAELIAYCKEVLASFKCPRSVDFDPALPRQDNGKLYKQKLVARYDQSQEV